MMQESMDFAKILLDLQKSKKSFDPVAIGRVISTSPLKVNDGDDIILDEELVVTLRIQQLIDARQLVAGDLVAMVANANLSKYIVIDKVV